MEHHNHGGIECGFNQITHVAYPDHAGVPRVGGAIDEVDVAPTLDQAFLDPEALEFAVNGGRRDLHVMMMNGLATNVKLTIGVDPYTLDTAMAKNDDLTTLRRLGVKSEDLDLVYDFAAALVRGRTAEITVDVTDLMRLMKCDQAEVNRIYEKYSQLVAPAMGMDLSLWANPLRVRAKPYRSVEPRQDPYTPGTYTGD